MNTLQRIRVKGKDENGILSSSKQQNRESKFALIGDLVLIVLVTLSLSCIAVVFLLPSDRRLQRQNMNGPVRRAEPERGDVVGTITRANSVPLSGVTVSILNVKTKKVLTKTDTDEDGRFFVNLEVGNYRLTTSLAGYSDIKRNVRVTPNETINLKVTMKELKTKGYKKKARLMS